MGWNTYSKRRSTAFGIIVSLACMLVVVTNFGSAPMLLLMSGPNSVESVQGSTTKLESPHLLASSSCIWTAEESMHFLCLGPLTDHLKASLTVTRAEFLAQHGNVSSSSRSLRRDRYINRRWLLLGDSTTARLFSMTELESFFNG
jgi:hypothetical protein